MTCASNIQRPFHLQLLPTSVTSQQAINVEIVQHSYGQQVVYQQNLMSLGAGVELPEVCDSTDVTIVILEGNGAIALNQQVVTLEPGMFIFVPAHTTHTLKTTSRLTFLLIRAQPDIQATLQAYAVKFADSNV